MGFLCRSFPGSDVPRMCEKGRKRTLAVSHVHRQELRGNGDRDSLGVQNSTGTSLHTFERRL